MFKYKEFVTHEIEEFSNGQAYDAYTIKEIGSEELHIEGEKLANNDFIKKVMGHLLGKVLTTVEATTSNDKQAKAIKDLMRNHFFDEMLFVQNYLFDQGKLDAMATEQVKDLGVVEPVSIDEVLGVK